ncbi:MAG: hypothetical protein ACRD3W_25500, partial [Terriglobales bacterium]
LYKNRGGAYGKLGQMQLAEQDLNKSLELSTSDSDAFKSRARLSIETGNYEQATADMAESNRLSKQGTAAAKHPIDARQYESVINGYDKLIVWKVGTLQTLYDRAVAEMCLGKLREAVSDFEHYLKSATAAGPISRATAILWCSMALRELHQEQEAKYKLDTFWQEVHNKAYWPIPIIEYLRGTESEEVLLKEAPSQALQTEARCIIGLNCAARNDSAGAIRNLQWVTEHGDPMNDAYFLAKRKLQELSGSKHR